MTRLFTCKRLLTNMRSSKLRGQNGHQSTWHPLPATLTAARHAGLRSFLSKQQLHRQSRGRGVVAVCLLFSPKNCRLALFLLVYGFSFFLSGSLSVNSIWPCSAGFQSLT